jgi:ribosomal protein L19
MVVFTLVGCETPSTVQRVSDYEICINEADRQIRVRGVNCGAYAGTILQQQQQGLNQMQQGLQQMQKGTGVQQQLPNRPNQTSITCTKIGDRNRTVYTFNAIACPVGYAPTY